jgi:hypothetical protein
MLVEHQSEVSYLLRFAFLLARTTMEIMSV